MLYRYQLKRAGFNAELEVGSVVKNNNGESFVIISIEGLRNRILMGQPTVWADVIVQKPDTPNVGLKFEKEVHFEMKYRIDGKRASIVRPPQVGQCFVPTHKNEPYTGVVVRVEEITSYHYEFTDLVVNLIATIVSEWSKREIDDCMREERLSTFSVINGGQQLVNQL